MAYGATAVKPVVEYNPKMKDLIIPMYSKVFMDIMGHKHTHYVGAGGRGSTKSSFYGGICIPLLIVNYPGVHAICFRKVGNTIQTSTYAQVVWGIYQLGLESLFHIPKTYSSPITYIPTGQKILFRGMDDPQKITSIAVEQGVLCWGWFEEAYQITDEALFNMVIMSIRGDIPEGSGLFFQYTLTFNPWRENWIKKRFFDDPKEDVFT